MSKTNIIMPAVETRKILAEAKQRKTQALAEYEQTYINEKIAKINFFILRAAENGSIYTVEDIENWATSYIIPLFEVEGYYVEKLKNLGGYNWRTCHTYSEYCFYINKPVE